MRHDSQRLIHPPHPLGPPLHQPLRALLNPLLKPPLLPFALLLRPPHQHSRPLPQPHSLKKARLLHRPVHLDPLARSDRGLRQRHEVHIRADVDRAGQREGADGAVVADSTKRICRDGVEWAVVEDEGGARGRGFGGGGATADARGEVGGVGERLGRDLNDGTGRVKKFCVARGGVREVEAVRGADFGFGELEVRDGGGAEGGWGVEGGVGGVGGYGRDDEFTPFVCFLRAFLLLAGGGGGDRGGIGEVGLGFRGWGRGGRGDAFENVDGEGVEEFVGDDEGSFGGV